MKKARRRTQHDEDITVKLERELQRLEDIFGIKTGLKVSYEPTPRLVERGGKTLIVEAEIKNGCIYIRTDREPIKVLQHEILEWMLNRITAPFQRLTNMMIQFVSEEAYKQREEFVNALMKFIESEANEHG